MVFVRLSLTTFARSTIYFRSDGGESSETGFIREKQITEGSRRFIVARTPFDFGSIGFARRLDGIQSLAGCFRVGVPGRRRIPLKH